MDSDQILKVFCNHCGHITNHRVVTEHVVQGDLDETAIGIAQATIDPEPHEPDWWDRYDMLECRGCESVCLRHTNYFGPTDQEDVYFYPPRVFRRLPEWRHRLPPLVGSLVDEVYKALAADSRRLAVMGARTLVDMVIAEKVGDQGPFRQKLHVLEEQGFVGKVNGEHLAAALDAGNAAAHRGHVPSTEAVAQVMDIVENLLQAVYVLGAAAEKLGRETPPRWPRKS
jgi:hypothetical protein